MRETVDLIDLFKKLENLKRFSCVSGLNIWCLVPAVFLTAVCKHLSHSNDVKAFDDGYEDVFLR